MCWLGIHSSSCLKVELGKSDSSLRLIFGAGSKYSNDPLSNDDQSTDLSSPKLKLIIQGIITVKIAATWKNDTISILLFLQDEARLMLCTSSADFISFKLVSRSYSVFDYANNKKCRNSSNLVN